MESGAIIYIYVAFKYNYSTLQSSRLQRNLKYMYHFFLLQRGYKTCFEYRYLYLEQLAFCSCCVFNILQVSPKKS